MLKKPKCHEMYNTNNNDKAKQNKCFVLNLSSINFMRQTRHFLIGFKVHSVWWNPYLTLIKLPEIGDLTVLHLSLSILYTFYFSQYSSDDIEITWVSKHGQIMEYVPKALLDVLWRAIKAQNSQYVVTEYNNKHNVSVQWRKKDHEASTTQEKL